ncbi:uncharacterized protein LOC126562568 [Anopheles maculipalpis]|uniref:uncharacterized protein LOC126562568 n=1 Tax=Anopheles maculipalpis TaxID=1496333 RepID=UPI0021596331|nr:uncharacterized protein LOC126562568 [Anopheles maculipalpis]
MAQKRPRISVGVMAVCCGVLSLSVVARESASHNEPGVSSRKYVAVHHHSVQPGTFASPVDAPDTLGMAVTTPLTPDPKATIENERHRKTRETNKLPRPATTSDESFSTSPTANQIRRRRMEPKIRGLPSPLVFMPARGRRFGGFEIPAEKRQITIEQMLEKGDYFVPNRGKKAPTTGELIKKGKFDVLLGGAPDEYFFPNRGKKQYWLSYDRTGGNVRPLVARGAATFDGQLKSFTAPQQLQKPIANRLRRNLLENLANEHKDTFFSSRGKRFLPFEEELMLVPSNALDEQLQSDSAQEGLSDERTQEFSGQSNDLDALLWDEDMLLSLEQPVS